VVDSPTGLADCFLEKVLAEAVVVIASGDVEGVHACVRVCHFLWLFSN